MTGSNTTSAHKPHCHVVGVAGVGMNALAQILVGEGYDVSGSDRYCDQGRDLDVVEKLRRAGVRIVPQDGSGVTAGTAAVAVSTAIESDNPDLAAARSAGVPIVHRAEMLAGLLAGKTCVAVTGTCGKTTVTGMIGWILEALGRDPTVVNGGALVDWAAGDRIGNVRPGRSGLWVVEADESDRSLLKFEPDWAVITNMSRDHFGMDETVALFTEFRSRVRSGCVGALDDRVPDSFSPELRQDSLSFFYSGVRFDLPLLGRHNAENALLAVKLCERMGLGLTDVRDALASFHGIQRRLEIVGHARGITVIDDYAHNTAKIGAVWRAVEPFYKRILAVWRPHGFAPLSNMQDDLVGLFADVCRPSDRLFILPVYYAGGTASRTVSSDLFVGSLQARKVAASLAPDYDRLFASLRGSAAAGDVILIMGARDPDLPLFARRVVAGMRG